MPKGTDTNKIRTGRVADRPYWILILSIWIRAFHQVGAAVFLTTFLLSEPFTVPPLYLALAGISGILLVITESARHRQFFREGSGLATLAKLGLIGLAWHTRLPAVPLVLAAFVMASFFSHAPKTIRHRLIF